MLERQPFGFNVSVWWWMYPSLIRWTVEAWVKRRISTDAWNKGISQSLSECPHADGSNLQSQTGIIVFLFSFCYFFSIRTSLVGDLMKRFGPALNPMMGLFLSRTWISAVAFIFARTRTPGLVRLSSVLTGSFLGFLRPPAPRSRRVNPVLDTLLSFPRRIWVKFDPIFFPPLTFFGLSIFWLTHFLYCVWNM